MSDRAEGNKAALEALPVNVQAIKGNLPARVVVDQHGHYWRDYGDFWSMPPVSEENVSTEPVAVFALAATPTAAPEAGSPGLDVERLALALLAWRGDYGRPLAADLPDAADLARLYSEAVKPDKPRTFDQYVAPVPSPQDPDPTP